MAEHILLVERAEDWKPGFPPLPVVTARDYLAGGEAFSPPRRLNVVNLCRSYRYLSIGYYCSLLAEARGHKVIPSVHTIQELSSRDIYGLLTETLNQRLQRLLGRESRASMPSANALTLFFGRCTSTELQPLARDIFETFRSPAMRVELGQSPPGSDGPWRIVSIKPLPLHGLNTEQEQEFLSALASYLSRRWREPRARLRFRYDLAILHDPDEDLPPSNPKALERFQQAGKSLGVNVELIRRKDFGRLAEYDALLIRETTRIGHHSFRFAKKAESEDMAVIDDPTSILRCTNKVFLAELLDANRVPRPRTRILRRETLRDVEVDIAYPIVLKIPEGSFSRGVFKVENRAELERISRRLFKESDLILAQEYLYTAFDWRIGILGRQPLYACKYLMSRDHWQIVRHESDGSRTEGGYETVRVEDVPKPVLRVALRAANLIGNGLYGVDVKATERGAVCIEVNDNPNIDAGVEDRILGDALYRAIVGHLIERLEQGRTASARGAAHRD